MKSYRIMAQKHGMPSAALMAGLLAVGSAAADEGPPVNFSTTTASGETVNVSGTIAPPTTTTTTPSSEERVVLLDLLLPTRLWRMLWRMLLLLLLHLCVPLHLLHLQHLLLQRLHLRQQLHTGVLLPPLLLLLLLFA